MQPSPPTLPKVEGRLASLDGWRALSICLVLGAHCLATWNCPPSLRPVVTWLFDGKLGVTIFFIISGFLITWLLIAEHDRNGRVSLGAFYLRRSLRILPIYFAFLGVLALLQALTPYRQPAAVWWANLTFTTNFLTEPVWTSGHLWSLAVEEQFYLLWPLLFVLLDCPRRPRRALFVLAVPVVVAPVARTLLYLRAAPDSLAWAFNPNSFLIHFDALAIGCACAFLLARNPAPLRAFLVERRLLGATLGLALLLVPYVLLRRFLLAGLTVPFGWTSMALGAAVLIVQSVLLGPSGLYALFNCRPARLLGVLSYSLYIWQQPFCSKPESFGLSRPAFMGFPFWILCALATAAVSYQLWEKPFLALRSRLRAA